MPDTGYIRISLNELEKISMVHLISGVDDDAPAFAPDGAVSTYITGYTEWISTGSQVVTIGWDWQMPSDDHKSFLKRVGGPSSNVMLLDAQKSELGHVSSARLLERFIDSFDWQSETLEYLNTRYRN
ncbi:DUF4902 domain-containing protein [Pseudoduganella sp.]|uniref:DUF4902 domain-containing protein n=1 Tax=Pseudoduganella sp. TaxID=1880898 RepID=UPI0035B20F75